MPEPLQPVDLPVVYLLLRPWRETDIRALWAAFHDPELRRWNGGGVASRTDALVLLGRRMDRTSGDHLLARRGAVGPPRGRPRAGGQHPQLTPGAVSGSAGARCTPSGRTTGRPSRAQYSNPPIISRTR